MQLCGNFYDTLLVTKKNKSCHLCRNDAENFILLNGKSAAINYFTGKSINLLNLKRNS